MRDATLIVATVLMAAGLVLIVWRELANAAERRQVGPLRDTAEVASCCGGGGSAVVGMGQLGSLIE